MIPFYIFTILSGSALYGSVFLWQSRPLMATQLLVFVTGLFLFIFTIINLVTAVKLTKSKGLGAWIPLLLAVTAWLLLPTAYNKGYDARIANFKKNLPAFTNMVERIWANSTAGATIGNLPVPEDYRHLVLNIRGEDNNGILHIEFMTGTDINNNPIGFLYSSNDNPGAWPGLRVWKNPEKILPRWYKVE